MQLAISTSTTSVPLVSNQGHAILAAIKALPSEERRQVLDEALLLRERAHEWEQQQAKLRDMQSRHAGRGLLQRLLNNRAEDRARG
jgi:hypothetical protein